MEAIETSHPDREKINLKPQDRFSSDGRSRWTGCDCLEVEVSTVWLRVIAALKSLEVVGQTMPKKGDVNDFLAQMLRDAKRAKAVEQAQSKEIQHILAEAEQGTLVLGGVIITSGQRKKVYRLHWIWHGELSFFRSLL